MFSKRNLCLLGLLFSQLTTVYQATAQTVFNNGTIALGNSDNTGSTYQSGTEVLSSIAGMGVIFETGGTFEHVGQFYVAEDGIWNHTNVTNTDYFGYAPLGVGSNLAYKGIGIMGASTKNGGRGAGRPTFATIELNSTGVFPVVAGMYITQSLVFNANGPGGSNVITTPAATTPDSPINAVAFAPTASIVGVNSANYINGYASVTNIKGSFSLPIGDSLSTDNPLHTLTINNTVDGTITARYLHTLRHPTTAREASIHWVSPSSSWPLSAPAGTNVTVDLPALLLSSDDATYLRLVGWNGHQWVDLSKTSTPGSCVTGNCPLTGTLTDHITDIAIGLSRKPANIISLTVWPSPTPGPLHLTMSADKIIDSIRVLDQQGRSMLNLFKAESTPSLDVSRLPVGSYILQVHTTDGQIFRQHFIRQ